MSIATKVIYDQTENTISLEKHQTSPVQLTNIKRERVANQSEAKGGDGGPTSLLIVCCLVPRLGRS
jgi:hypothetical protein